MNLGLKMAVYAGILVLLLVSIFIADSINPPQEADIVIDLNTQIQDYAAQNGILLTKADSVTNMFAQGVRFGGAGGIVNMQVDYSNNSVYLEVLKTNNHLDNIVYIESVANLEGDLVRTYYAIAYQDGSSVLARNNQVYSPPAANYVFKSSTATTATFEHDVSAANDGMVMVLIVALIVWFFFGAGIIEAFSPKKDSVY